MSARLTLTGRADLLRALSRAEGQVLQIRHGRVLGFDFEPPVEEAVPTVFADTVESLPPVVELPPAPSDQRPPLQTSFFALTGYRKLPDPTPEEVEAENAAKARAGAVQPLTDKDCEPTGAPLPFQPLVRRERLWPRLRQSLQQSWTAGVDLSRLVSHLSRGDLPRSLPARRHSGLTAQVFVLWDAADRLTPYAEDYRRLIAQLHQLHGAAGLRLWRVHDGPDEVWGEWAPERVAWPERWPGRSWRKQRTEREGTSAGLPEIPAGSRVLLLSDLGGLARHPAPARRWLRALRRWRADGVATTAWLPQGPRWVAPALAAQADELHCLTPTPQRVRATSRPGSAGSDSLATHLERHRARQDALCDELLTRASICIHLEPELLRSLRHSLPALAAEPGLEALAWSRQPEVRSSRVSRALAPEFAPAYRQRFGELSPPAQRDVLRRVTEAHACLGRSTPVTEVLIWHAHARPAAAQAAETQIQDAMGWTHAWALRVEHRARSGASEPEGRAFAADLWARTSTDEQFIRRQSEWASRLWALAGVRDLPGGLDDRAALAARAVLGTDRPGQVVSYFIVQRNGCLALLSNVRELTLNELGVVPSFDSRQCMLVEANRRRRVLDPRPELEPLLLARRGDPGRSLKLRTESLELEITEVVRPNWASEWGEDKFGRFATLEVGGTPQRLRYLPPGRFLMGSPADELERYDGEGPQHEVTLTRGFWLADTCCTQALWLAVMGGDNPSAFKGDPNLPVDNVSWDDAQAFLSRLQEHLPRGVEAVLPTEAQWEYACRAGTTTRFSFGDELSQEQANFSGRLRRTVRVKSKPANPWGLYEVHGNLWEWCSDARRSYAAEPVEDPDGGQGGVKRVLRGGARLARSALRHGGTRDSRDQLIGFRFALRSIEPSAGGGIPGRAEPARVLPQVEPGAGVGPAEPGPRANLDDPKFMAFLKSLIGKRGG